MLRRRISYGLALAAAAVFQICFSDYLSWFVLVLVVCFPLLSLAASLPVIRGCSFSLSAPVPAVERGECVQWSLRLANRTRLPLSQAVFTLRARNLLTGERDEARRTLSGASGGKRLGEQTPAPHCGAWECEVASPRVCDLLGLFSFRLPPPPPCRVLVLPVPAPEAPPPGLDRGVEGAGMKPRPGGGPGEDYDLRPYRPGDPLRSVHWKLSSKLDDLVVRETLEPRRNALVLTFDHFGAPDALDRVLDRLSGLSRALLARERPHFIQWAEPVSGALRSYAVASEHDLLACLAAALSEPAPPTGRSVLDGPVRAAGGDGPARHYHVADPEGGGAQ